MYCLFKWLSGSLRPGQRTKTPGLQGARQQVLPKAAPRPGPSAQSALTQHHGPWPPGLPPHTRPLLPEGPHHPGQQAGTRCRGGGGATRGAGRAVTCVHRPPRGVRREPAPEPLADRLRRLRGPASRARRHVELQPAQRHQPGRGPAPLPARPAGPVGRLPALPGGRRPARPGLQQPADPGEPARAGQHGHARRLLREHGRRGPAAQRPGACAPAGPRRLRVGLVGLQQRGPRHAAGAVRRLRAGDHVLHGPAQPGLLHRAGAAAHLHVQRLQQPARVRLRLGRRPAHQLLLPALLHLQPRGRPAGRVRPDAAHGGCRRHHGAHRVPGARPGRALRPGAGLPDPQAGHAPRPGGGEAGPLGAPAPGGHRVHAVRALDAALPDAPGAHVPGLAGLACGRAAAGAAALCEGPVPVPRPLQQRRDAAALPLHQQELPRQAAAAGEEDSLRAPELLRRPGGGPAGAGVGSRRQGSAHGGGAQRPGQACRSLLPPGSRILGTRVTDASVPHTALCHLPPCCSLPGGRAEARTHSSTRRALSPLPVSSGAPRPPEAERPPDGGFPDDAMEVKASIYTSCVVKALDPPLRLSVRREMFERKSAKY